MDGGIVSRAASESATSKGLRSGIKIRGEAPMARITSHQNGKTRPMRGSFRTSRRLSAYSPRTMALARSCRPAAVGDRNQSARNGSQSSQAEPADSRMASFSAAICSDSQ